LLKHKSAKSYFMNRTSDSEVPIPANAEKPLGCLHHSSPKRLRKSKANATEQRDIQQT